MSGLVLAVGALWFAGIAVLVVVAGAVVRGRRRTRRATDDPAPAPVTEPAPEPAAEPAPGQDPSA